MATVYLAQDTKHRRPVALKVLHPELAASLGPERFRREIELAARLQHPHITAGVEVKAPAVTYYGMTQLSLKDPDGFGLCFQRPATQGGSPPTT